MDLEPLILSPAAARRLKLLLGHGAVELPSKLQQALPPPSHRAAPNGTIVEEEANQPLWADVLAFPTEAQDDGKGPAAPTAAAAAAGRRDTLAELALHPSLMHNLSVSMQ